MRRKLEIKMSNMPEWLFIAIFMSCICENEEFFYVLKNESVGKKYGKDQCVMSTSKMGERGRINGGKAE
jgi:hypothetical protein